MVKEICTGMLQICKNYGIFQFRYIYITIYKDGAVINQQVSKISLYQSSTETTGMSLTNKPDI